MKSDNNESIYFFKKNFLIKIIKTNKEKKAIKGIKIERVEIS